MPTKYVILWLETCGDNLDQINTLSDWKTSLEDAWRFYNEVSSRDTTLQIMMLIPIKEFQRSKNEQK